MKQEVNRMRHTTAFLVAIAAAAVAGCASAGAPAPGGSGGDETARTRAATVHLVQAGLSEGEQAMAAYRQALDEALLAIQETPDNPRAYLVAGQAAIGLNDWVQADTMFDRSLALEPGYADQIEAERESGWVVAYNLGAEALNNQDLDRAQEMFEAADRLYQGRPEARLGLGSLHANRGEMGEAANAYVSALEILQRDPPEGLSEEQMADWRQARQAATLNAAELLAQTGDFARAAETLETYLRDHGDELDEATTRRARTALAGFYAQAGDSERAEQMYTEILGQGDVTYNDYFQAGIGFFNTDDYARAAESFGQAAELNPYSRDAQLNLVQSLYSQALALEEEAPSPDRDAQLVEIYEEIQEAGAAVREMDPLNRNLLGFVLRSYRSLADLEPSRTAELNQAAQAIVREYQEIPFEISDIQINMQSGDQARVTGTLTTLTGTAGEQIQLRFELLGSDGQVVGSTNIDVTLPAQGESVAFEGTTAVQGGTFDGWRYQLVE